MSFTAFLFFTSITFSPEKTSFSPSRFTSMGFLFPCFVAFSQTVSFGSHWTSAGTSNRSARDAGSQSLRSTGAQGRPIRFSGQEVGVTLHCFAGQLTARE
mmetsp:Transcript_1439/g.4565  ORF Transcript_1439/g.4565 Transcript_1439/m.4565 type:complete len:100 (+) Transcript_1439:92-391(+)